MCLWVIRMMKDKQEKLETEVVDMEKEGIDVEIE